MVKRDLIRNIILAIIFSLVLFFIGRFYISIVKVTQENENSFLKAGDVLVYTKQTKPKENDFIVYEKSGHALDKDPEAAQKAKEIIKNYAEMYFAEG